MLAAPLESKIGDADLWGIRGLALLVSGPEVLGPVGSAVRASGILLGQLDGGVSAGSFWNGFSFVKGGRNAHLDGRLDDLISRLTVIWRAMTSPSTFRAAIQCQELA